MLYSIIILSTILSVLYLIKTNRVTMPFIALTYIPFFVATYFIKSWVALVVLLLGLGLVCYKKYTIIQSGMARFRYNERILSVNGVKNLLKSKQNKVVLGNIMPINLYELKYNNYPIVLDNSILSKHFLITGTTGSGKTTTLKSVLKQNANLGKSILFFDYKGEEGILDELEEFANKKGIPYFEFSTRRCDFSYDPFINLNETGKVEALMSTRRWDSRGADEHYKTGTQLLIQNVIRSYDKVREKDDKTNYIVGLYRHLLEYKPETNEIDGHKTLVKQLEILLSSRAAQMFVGNKEKFTFETDEQYIIAFSFTASNKSLANYISAFVFRDLMDRGARKKFSPNTVVVVDEFGTLENSSIIKDLLNMGRSVGLQVLFSVLDVNLITENQGEAFVNSILGAIGSFIIHAGSTKHTAELLSGVQKYDKDFDIMSVRPPIPEKNIKPTAVFITKHPIVNRKDSQETYRYVPYDYKDNTQVEKHEKKVLNINIEDFEDDDDEPTIINIE